MLLQRRGRSFLSCDFRLLQALQMPFHFIGRSNEEPVADVDFSSSHSAFCKHQNAARHGAGNCGLHEREGLYRSENGAFPIQIHQVHKKTDASGGNLGTRNQPEAASSSRFQVPKPCFRTP